MSSLWLFITSNLHSQVGKMLFSSLPENMVNVTAGATGSYLVKAAMLNLKAKQSPVSGTA